MPAPHHRSDGSRRYNSVALIDRTGQVIGIYNKLYPVWQSQCMKRLGHLGSVAVVELIRRVGFAICFDVNWVDLWERMANLSAWNWRSG